jgi:REase_AHJR-like
MSEERDLGKIAERYRDEGYEVILRPRGKDVPEFLDRFEPDLIARNGSESVVVEAKTRTDLATDPHLRHLASVINAQPGWRLDLVVTNPEIWPDEVSSGAVERNISEIRSLSQTADRLVSLDEIEAAHMIAWSAAEAAMREVARRQDIPLERKHPQFVMNTLYSEGMLSRSDYEKLQEAMRIRNAVGHGLKCGRLDPRLPVFLIKVVDRLLDGAVPRSKV